MCHESFPQGLYFFPIAPPRPSRMEKHSCETCLDPSVCAAFTVRRTSRNESPVVGSREARELWGNVEDQAKHQAARLESVVRAQRENGENALDEGLQGHLKRQRRSSRYQLRAASRFSRCDRANADKLRLLNLSKLERR